MKKVLKILGILVGILVLLVAIVLAYFNFKELPTYEVKAPDLAIQPDSALLARGEYLVGINCALCHRGEDNKLSGMYLEDAGPFGKVYSANITRHEEFGIGQYSSGELAYLLRTGIQRDGKLCVPLMPKFNHLSDDDLKAVIAYLQSDAPMMQPSEQTHPEISPTLLGKILLNLALKPLPYPSEAISAPPTSDQVAHGKYVATAMIHCFHCHSASFETANEVNPELTEGYMGGGTPCVNLDDQVSYTLSANLTMHPEHGIGNWTPDQFVQAVRYGQGADGVALSSAMPRFTNMTEEDAKAIWAYLQTIPVMDKDVQALAAGQ